MPDIFCYDIGGSNPADVILTDPTTLSPNIHTNVRPTQTRARGSANTTKVTGDISVILYQGSAVLTDVQLRAIGLLITPSAGGNSFSLLLLNVG